MVNGDSVLSLRGGRKADEAISSDSLYLRDPVSLKTMTKLPRHAPPVSRLASPAQCFSFTLAFSSANQFSTYTTLGGVSVVLSRIITKCLSSGATSYCCRFLAER